MINLFNLNNEFPGFRKFNYMHGGIEGHGGSESVEVNNEERDIVEVDEKEFEAMIRAREEDAKMAEKLNNAGFSKDKLVRSNVAGASDEELRNEIRRIVGEGK